MLYVEARWPGVYYNPQRWTTADGYMPFRVFQEYAAALWPAYALERLNLARAIGLALASEKDVQRIAAATVAEAYPGEA